VSIGTHDLDTVKGPFRYEARKPQDISFAPLNMTETFDGEQLMQKLSVRLPPPQFCEQQLAVMAWPTTCGGMCRCAGKHSHGHGVSCGWSMRKSRWSALFLRTPLSVAHRRRRG